jgi:hypothetical protein
MIYSAGLESASQVVTLYCGGPDELVLNPYQTADIVARMAEGQLTGLLLKQNGVEADLFRSPLYNRIPDDHWTPIKGPATLRLSCGDPGYVSIRISAEAYPPDKTMILLPGTNSYNVWMEGSTNLVDWATATNGVYKEPSALFFRINSERVE